MIYLLLAIVSSMLVSVVMRLSEKHCRNNLSLLAVNYLMCSVLGLVLTGSMQVFPKEEGLSFALIGGVISGVMYLGSFVFYQWNIRKNGVVLPATFMKLGVVVPTVLAIAAFGEKPGIWQIAGIAAAIAAIVMMQGKGGSEKGSIASLVLLMLAGGSTDATSKVYEQFGSPALENHYLMYTFAVAFVLCVALCICKKQSISLNEILFGLAIGIPNYFSSRFLLSSLESVPAVVAFPSYSVGTIVLVTVIGVAFFKEKLSRRKMAALGVILAALAMLNL